MEAYTQSTKVRSVGSGGPQPFKETMLAMKVSGILRQTLFFGNLILNGDESRLI